MPLAYLPPIFSPQKRAQDLVIETQEAISGSDRRQLAAVARRVHRGDRRWIPPLPYARQNALQPGSLFHQAPAAGFLGITQNLGLGDEAIGAVAVFGQVAEEAGSTGWWGLFDAINVSTLAEQLFYRGETWLFEHTPGIVRLAGPASMEPLTPPGMLVDGFDALPAALMPYNPPYYPELVEGEGYERARHWNSWTLSCPAASETAQRASRQVDWRILTALYDAGADSEEGAPGLRRWLAHLTREETFPAHAHLRWALRRAFDRAQVVTSNAGACFGIPDFAPALRLTGGRLFPLGYALFLLALQRTRRLRVFPALAPDDGYAEEVSRLYGELAAQACERGYRELVIAPIFDEDEKSAEALSSLGARITQQFAIYEKEL